jgi:hypothetical protein
LWFVKAGCEFLDRLCVPRISLAEYRLREVCRYAQLPLE